MTTPDPLGAHHHHIRKDDRKAEMPPAFTMREVIFFTLLTLILLALVPLAPEVVQWLKGII